MDFFIKGYTALQGEKGQIQTGPETVDKLCDRAQSSTLIEDRRAAVLSLKSLARDYQLEVGTRGMPIFINVLTEDRNDPEITRAALEALNTVCTAQTNTPGDQDLGVMFTEIFVKTTANVSLLLGLLEVYDFYVRYHTVTLLTLLLENRPKQLQACILESPLGVSRLIDLLDDKREAIRNEGLLLLISLTKANTDIQKIVAFENAFERLLSLIHEEGLSDGGIIVSDCLQLILNLLRGNVSNQNYFRETSGFGFLPQLFVTQAPAGDASSPVIWSEQKQQNLSLMMELVRLFVPHRTKGSAAIAAAAAAASSPNSGTPVSGPSGGKAANTTTTNQTLFAQNGVLQAITEFALAQDVPVRVKHEALLVVADLIRGVSAAQDLFAKSVSRGTGGVQDAVTHLIWLAITSQIPFNIRTAATYCFKCYVHKRAELRSVLTASLSAMPPSAAKLGTNVEIDAPGPLLFKTVIGWETSRKDPYLVWIACTLVSCLVSGESKCKDRVLELHVPIDGDDMPTPFVAQVSEALLTATDSHADVRVLVAYLSLLATLLYQHTKSVKSFLEETSYLQFLVEQVNRSTGVEPIVQSLSAFVLGIILQFNDNSGPTLRKEDIQEIILSRIGEDQFLQKLQALRDSEAVRNNNDLTLPFKPSEGKTVPTLLFDTDFVQFVSSAMDNIERAVLSAPPIQHDSPATAAVLDPSTADVVVESYKGIIRDQDTKIAKLNEDLKAVKSELQSASLRNSQVITTPSPIASTPNQELIGTIEALKLQVQKLTDENAALKKVQLSQSLMPVSANGDLVSTLQQELAAQKHDHQQLQEEMDDLLVVLAESDQKVRDLKGRLRVIGQQVSDDEEDEDEGELDE